MRAVIQRVTEANVTVDDQTIGQIDRGLLVLLGVAEGDTEKDLDYLFEKTIGLRIFEDEDGKMNLGLKEVEGQLLVVSQFTLLGDTRKGKRPSFIGAAAPEIGNRFYEQFVARAREQSITTETGRFGADMKVALVNDGPVTILLDSRKAF